MSRSSSSLKFRLGALAVNFRGGGQQQRRGIFRGGAQQNLRLVKAGFQNVQRGFDDQFHADGRREVKNKFRVRREFPAVLCTRKFFRG
jgi:hypothetical protein